MDIDRILLAVAVMIAATVVAGSVAKKLNLGSTVALLAVGCSGPILRGRC
jgi:Kef-type K+ transport system membrane component KefB